MPSQRFRIVAAPGLRILVGTIALIVLAAAVYCLIECVSGHRQLRAVRQDLTARGILRPLSEITSQPSQEAIENGRQFLKTIEPLAALTKAAPAVRDGPDILRITTPGIAVAITNTPAPVFSFSKKETRPKSWGELRSQLQPGREIMTEACRLLRQPIALEYDYTIFSVENSYGEIPSLVAWLRTSTILKLHDRDISGALDDLASLQRLSILVGGANSIIRNASELRIWNFGLTGLFWETLQTDSWTDADLARMDKILSKGDFVADVLRAEEIEAAIMPFVYRGIKQSIEEKGTWPFVPHADGVLGTAPALWMRNALWPSIWSDADLARTLSSLGGEIQKTREAIPKKSWPVVMARCPKYEWAFSSYDLYRFPFACTFLDLSGISRPLLLAAFKTETNRELMRTALALERYWRQHGDYPDDLEQLIPGYLKSLPHDWFSGETLKYRRVDESQFLLYSVGENGLNDGGDATPPAGAKPSFNSGRDIVWPRTALPKTPR